MFLVSKRILETAAASSVFEFEDGSTGLTL